jgi:hypothetical protein
MGLQTRQAQSITWATKRKLFDNISDKKKAEIDAAWRAYHDNPKMTLEEV